MSTAGDDARLTALQAKWGRAWKVWRSTNYQGQPGDWCASRLDPKAGIYPTIVKSTPDALNDALHEQARFVAEGRKPPILAEAGPE